MDARVISVLAVDVDVALCAGLQGPGFVVSQARTLPERAEHDVLLLQAPNAAALEALAQRAELPRLALDCAIVVFAPDAGATLETALLRLGVEALVMRAGALPRALRHAVVRKQVERAARTAYATDLATGLPHQAQLFEHMTHLLALREREPAPMVLLVLRVEGLAQVASGLGAEAANILRRKVAVRLRGGLRASDVVASLGPDAFAVLLGHLDALADGERVAAKLVRALQAPLLVAGHPCSISASVGLALYPDHGKDAQTLLQRASAQAGSVATLGSEGFAAQAQRGVAGAANDEAP